MQVACGVFLIRESCHPYKSRQSAQNEGVVNWLMRLTDQDFLPYQGKSNKPLFLSKSEGVSHPLDRIALHCLKP